MGIFFFWESGGGGGVNVGVGFLVMNVWTQSKVPFGIFFIPYHLAVESLNCIMSAIWQVLPKIRHLQVYTFGGFPCSPSLLELSVFSNRMPENNSRETARKHEYREANICLCIFCDKLALPSGLIYKSCTRQAEMSTLQLNITKCLHYPIIHRTEAAYISKNSQIRSSWSQKYTSNIGCYPNW